MSLTPASSGRGGSRAPGFALASGEVHIWCAGLDVAPEASARFYETLAPDERSRSTRFRFASDRQRFVAARGLLRDLLARYLQTGPERITFVYNAFGKPGLSPDLDSPLKFNLSHSAGLALIAIVPAADVGVDVEYIREQADCADLARCFFSAGEAEHLMALPSGVSAESFFSCWTKKEAYLKARGEGLATPLNSFSVPVTADPGPMGLCVEANDRVPARHWSLYTLRPAPGYTGALAIEGSGWRLTQWQWPWTMAQA